MKALVLKFKISSEYLKHYKNRSAKNIVLESTANLNNSFVIIAFGIFLILTSISSFSQPLFAQHHGAPPPMATLGERNISMILTKEPNDITSDQDAQITMHLTDENTGQIIQHVTYRITISKDDQLKLSEFFHSHVGDLTITARNSNASHLTVGGNFDVLTNAIIPDPAGKIVVHGPLFAETGQYNIDVEITTIDNDKTDLQVPLQYQFRVNSTATN